ncbi:hypothetical protein ACFY00_36225 [Kitasatospora sp. NPDC001540]|uniref:hypothetical protein n=1 Tax=Kitasatospora sp. NPDC001540 TaxID=3364014 RepID=UPI0036C6C39E
MRTHRERVESLGRTIAAAHGMWGAGDLKDAVDAAVRLPGPAGSPDALDTLGRACVDAAARISEVWLTVVGIGSAELPEAWTGRVGESAAEVVKAAADDLDRMGRAHQQAGRRLLELCDALDHARARHAAARDPLLHASHLLADLTTWEGLPDPTSWDDDRMHEAKAAAEEGIAAMLDAAQQAEEAGHRAAAELNRLAAGAEAARLRARGLSAADRLTLTATTALGDLNRILGPQDAARAGQALDRLAPADRQRMDRLLADSRSPQERAYLLKALAAGHGVDEVAAFDRQIHDHGADPHWLGDRLSPVRLDSAAPTAGTAHLRPVGEPGARWQQADAAPTCVAASTVTMRAMADPVYALQLTTGGHPGDPGYDNKDAFTQRLTAEQNRVYRGSREWYQDLPLVGRDGLSDGQSRDVMNQEVGAVTGTEYRNVDLGGQDARRDVLIDVEKAVDGGRPVPVTIRGGDQGHQLMIIGHSGDKLQVYNPWGYTVWITEDDFVDNRMGNALDQPSPMNTATSVRLPK